MSLANNMFIGAMPFVLKQLTLAECMLIACAFPVAFITKLYPKMPGAAAWDELKLHKGLRGNVSTHPLPIQAIAHKINDGVMPPPIKILSTIIRITFLGPKNVSKVVIPPMFHVH